MNSDGLKIEKMLNDKKPKENPYPGARPFQKEESNLFFGRESITKDLLARLETSRFIPVVGGSGCGKSSFVYAGVIPALEFGFGLGDKKKWQVLTLKPEYQPIRNLAQQLSTIVEDEPIEGIEKALRLSPHGIVKVAKKNEILEQCKILILVDQFEEIFQFEQTGYEARRETADFISLLIESSWNKEVDIHVMLTMRSEKLSECSRFLDLPLAFNQGMYLIPKLNRKQVKASILAPIDGEMEWTLVNRLLNAYHGHSDDLPRLQHLLMRMWSAWDYNRKLDLDDYDEAGGMRGSINEHIDQHIIPTLEKKGITLSDLKILFTNLVSKDVEGNENSTPKSIQELNELAPKRVTQISVMIDAFRARDVSFLVTQARYDEPIENHHIVRLGHESLARRWSSLKSWLKEAEEVVQSNIKLRNLVKDRASLTTMETIDRYQCAIDARSDLLVNNEYKTFSRYLKKQRSWLNIWFYARWIGIPILLVVAGITFWGASDQHSKAVVKENEVAEIKNKAADKIKYAAIKSSHETDSAVSEKDKTYKDVLTKLNLKLIKLKDKIPKGDVYDQLQSVIEGIESRVEEIPDDADDPELEESI